MSSSFTLVVSIRHVEHGCNPESVTCGWDLTSVTQYTECYCGKTVAREVTHCSSSMQKLKHLFARVCVFIKFLTASFLARPAALQPTATHRNEDNGLNVLSVAHVANTKETHCYIRPDLRWAPVQNGWMLGSWLGCCLVTAGTAVLDAPCWSPWCSVTGSGWWEECLPGSPRTSLPLSA